MRLPQTSNALALAAASLLTCATAQAKDPDTALLVRNAYIFSMADTQKEPFLGYMTVDANGTIITVHPGNPSPRLHASSTLDAHGHWIIPGFISAHSHLWQAAYRGLAANRTLRGWIDELYGDNAHDATPEDFYWFTLDGALDHLQHGITTAFNFNYSNHWGAAPSEKDNVDHQQFRAELASGMRFVHGIQPTVDSHDHSRDH
ncbi:amidohydrolase family protein [Gluconobacter wancherniae]|uniref:amidohydrolase family protein n=1 Tax=Gluconobacter wancherniae TaxID=1307955 RepID=UPI001B8B1F93|nr:amidohydrolase family protein [Gluconobacter wancherniae]MBS1093050.1 amidohydrolase family protein [Gluconobacter wancherniae]